MSIVCLAYNTLTRMSMSEIKDMADMEFDELLEQVDVGELDIVKSCINE